MCTSKFQMLRWENLIWGLCTLLTCTPVIHCEYTITPASMPENKECNGGTAMFNWAYSPATPDPTSVTWTKRYSDGKRAATLATFAFKNFTVDPAYTGRVTRTGSTGQIELSNIQSTDEGMYRIEVADINSKTTNGTGNLKLLEPPNGSLVVTTGIWSLEVSELPFLGFPAARVICKNERNQILVNGTPPFVQRNVSCGTYTCCMESLAVSKCLPSTDPLRTCKVVVVDGLGCWPLLSVGIVLLVVGIIITVFFVLGQNEIMFQQGDPSIGQHPKNTIIVRDLNDKEEVEERFERYLEEHNVNVVKKSNPENGHKVWTIKGGEAHLSLNPPKGKVNVQHPKNTIYVLDLKDPKEVEANFEKYLKKHYYDVVQMNGHTVWTMKGGMAHLSFNSKKGKIIGTFEIKFKEGDTSIVQHPKNTIYGLDLKDPKEVEEKFEKYLKGHYDDVVKMILGTALSNNIAESPDELAFQRGDVLTVIESDTGKDGWWLCSLHSKLGLAPGDKLKILSGEESISSSYENLSTRKSWDSSYVKNSDAENGDKVWTIKGGEAHLSLNPPKGQVNGTFEIKFKQSDLSIGQNEIMFLQGDPYIADKLRLVNFIYSIIHCAAGLIMMIIIAVLACTPLEGVCIGAHIFSLLNLLYGFGNIILTLTWKHKSYVWLCWNFCGCYGSHPANSQRRPSQSSVYDEVFLRI